MTNEETAMEKLLDVQAVDLRIRDMETEAASIPAGFKKWENLVAGKKAGLVALETQVEDSKKSLRQFERDLDQKQEDLGKYNSQLPMIKTNREYKAILLEIDGVEKDISDIEEAILERMTETETIETRVAAEQTEVDETEQEAQREKQKLDEKLRQVQEALVGTRSERERLAASVDGGLLSQYDRIRIKKGGLATAKINDESCGACHMLLPPQVVNEVIGEAVKVCPSCNRLLYWMKT
jgi:hypothetical protein